jgi:hypothetical protein
MEAKDRYQAAIIVVRDDPNNHVTGPQPEERIALAERELGLAFPPSYRTFLLELGSGIIQSQRVLGVYHSDFANSNALDVVGMTRMMRDDGAQEGLVVFYYDGSEWYHAIDTRQRDDRGESPVVWWSPPPAEGIGSRVADDFAAWFVSLAEGTGP